MTNKYYKLECADCGFSFHKQEPLDVLVCIKCNGYATFRIVGELNKE